MKPKGSAVTTLALLLLLQRVGGFANVIAQQGAGDTDAPSWFDGLPTWHVPTSTVPASPAVPADAPSRDMVFGSPLVFSVYPVDPTSTFSVNLTFLDDGGDRIQTLSVGGKVISPKLVLTPMAVYTVQFELDSSCATPVPGTVNEYQLIISMSVLQGPNAILSAFALSSSNASDPPIVPPAPQVPTHALPRLTPRALSVEGTDGETVPLMGTWLFDPAPSPTLLSGLAQGGQSALAALSGNGWSNITVPGEYTLQGFRVASGQPVVYSTPFTLPASWTGLRTKLRCDGVYSNATVYVNGMLAGTHLGGFTPFELDVTPMAAPGSSNNTLTVVVVSASLADTLASGTQYATHDLGGITRKIYLHAVPAVSVADVHVVTTFADASYTDGFLFLNVSVANDGASSTTAPATVDVVLSYGGATVATGSVSFPAALPGGMTVVSRGLNLSVPSPAQWDPEHPRLHNLTLTLSGAGPREVVSLPVGFREVGVAGNRVVVNGRPIKARGTTRHEAHPLVGRSLWSLPPAGLQWERDILTFRDANINYIRTSHYPPSEELMAAADELGMLIELEMPFCWASGNTGSAAFDYTVQAQREAMVFNRNHPSVLQWSLGNESPWTANFDNSLGHYLRELDWTRPFMFDGGDQQPIPPLNVLSVHYPSFDGPAQYANGSQPTLFGEYAHLNCYNRREVLTDPGVRDIWGLGIEHMWELVYASPGVLGACYWAGIDDIFYMPSTQPVGYGEWGVIDGWRRAKPETFLVRNIYSPVKLVVPPPNPAWAPNLTVANRHDFTDLSEVAFKWELLEMAVTGTGTSAGGPHTDNLTLTLHGLPFPLMGHIQVNATSPRGFLISSWVIPLQPDGRAARQLPAAARAGSGVLTDVPPRVTELPDGRLMLSDVNGQFTWFVSPEGSVSGNTSAGLALASGPALMVLPVRGEDSMQLVEGAPPITPFSDPLVGWALANRSYTLVNDAVVVTLAGAYANATGSFTLSFTANALLTAAYSFQWAQEASVAPRQVGLVFSAPADFQSLSWRRAAPWSAYPGDHIGRPAGDNVSANPAPPPGNQPRTGSWSADPTPLGTADFRSTKHNVTAFQLASAASGAVLSFVSNGTQHGRAWVGPSSTVQLLAADLSNEGGNPFSREKVLPQPVYRTGDTIAGQVTLQLGQAIY